MIAACVITNRPTLFGALTAGMRKAMDVILHIGAHRTASTSFQAYLRGNAARLDTQGVRVWDPRRTRNGLFAGLWPDDMPATRRSGAERAAGRLALALADETRRGTGTLIVTDENIIGMPREGIRARRLYPAAGERAARVAAAFQGRITRAVLSIRCPDAYWASLIAMTAARGRPLPGPHRIAALADSARTWRDVITDVACALPGVPLLILPHEVFGATPERRLAAMLPGLAEPPMTHARNRLNAAPRLPQLWAALTEAGRDTTHLMQGEGAFAPFTPAQSAKLQEDYADDLFWLTAGADGLATLITGKTSAAEGKTPVAGPTIRGQAHDHKGRVAQAG